jgi:hypothetical protein
MAYELNLTNLSPLATLHSITLNLTQQTTSHDSNQVDLELFTLFQHGRGWETLWQGDLALASEMAMTKTKSAKGKQPNINDDSRKRSSSGDRSSSNNGPTDVYKVKGRARLPSPAIGGIARWAFSTEPPYLSMTEHDLRLDITYSVLGEDERGEPLPPIIPAKPKHGFNPTPASTLQPGKLRTCFLYHHIYVYDCSASPSNLELPNYQSITPLPPPKYVNVDGITMWDMPGPFRIPRSTSRKVNGEPVKIMEKRDGLLERVLKHGKDTGGRCLCLLDEGDVWRAVGEVRRMMRRNDGQIGTGLRGQMPREEVIEGVGDNVSAGGDGNDAGGDGVGVQRQVVKAVYEGPRRNGNCTDRSRNDEDRKG